jgi:hypothetical protein
VRDDAEGTPIAPASARASTVILLTRLNLTAGARPTTSPGKLIFTPTLNLDNGHEIFFHRSQIISDFFSRPAIRSSAAHESSFILAE